MLFSVIVLGLATTASAGGLTDIKHVVLFMQENRAFDHYFGTMAGVRGFSDPNVQVNPDGRTCWQQIVTPDLSNVTTTLMPWYLNYLGGTWNYSNTCTGAGQNSFQDNHAALNHDLNNMWAVNNTPQSWGHFQREDIPVQFAIQEAWTIADMYQEGVIAATEPNRVMWMTGSINTPGGPQSPSQGGAVLDNNGTPGCEAVEFPENFTLWDPLKPNEGYGFACFPFNWKTVPEFHQDAGVSWMVYQDVDNYGDDALSSFFYADAEAGTLPQDGGWLQQQVINAVVNGAAYNETVLMISYDETGGWGDHVTPFHSPENTPGEWMNVENDVFGYIGNVYTGPGFRVPFTIISPWTRGGHVFTEHTDHNSQIMFVEAWLEALGYEGVVTDQMSSWRRTHMSNLLNAFDFDNPDYSIPVIPTATVPSEDADGNWDAADVCQGIFGTPPPKPPPPYGPENANLDPSTLSEEGFKHVRGYLTEGRCLVFEMNGYALTALNGASDITGSKSTSKHESINQRWVIHATGGTATDGGEGAGTFVITSAVDGKYIASHTSLAKLRSGAETYTIAYTANGAGYALQKENGKYLSIDTEGTIIITSKPASFSVYSVTYQS
ncbi:hypothetical protein B7463_g4716, partial [Scytalidium lignicola]